MSFKQYCILILPFMLVLGACSNTKYLEEGQSLYVGSNVEIKDKEGTKRQRKVLEEDLEGAIQPKPNTKILGLRVKLWLYNIAGEPKKGKGLKHWLRTKVGEPPVLASQFDLEYNRKLLINIMENRGYFFPVVEADTNTRNKKTKGKFEVVTGPQYKIREIHFPDDTVYSVAADVNRFSENSLLEKDAPYNLDLFKAERERIDNQLKEIGYYYFSPNYLLMQIDSTVGAHQVDVYVSVKYGEMPTEAYHTYRIKDVYIYPDFEINDDTTYAEPEFYERFYIIDSNDTYKPSVFLRAMRFEPGDLYNRTDHNMALNRLVNMNTFKFVKNDFQPTGTGPLLDVYYYLTPRAKKSLRAEAGALTKNDSRAGSELSISWQNRNALRGAELFAIKAYGGFEAQYGGAIKRPNTYQLGIEPSITFPRFVVPFFEPQGSSMFVPKTILRAGYDFLVREGLYRLHSFKAGYGYTWKETLRKEHEFFPININYVLTDTIAKDTNIDINFANLVFDGLIIGPTYQYTYNTRVGTPNKHDFYFNGFADLSGNILGLVQGAKYDETTHQPTRGLFGATYAQYVKLQTDFRYYYNYGYDPASIWANRLFIGVGMPYGNSYVLPNVKQFFSGGNSSLRGFRSRLVGPGTFNEQYLYGTNNFIETNGDIKLEFNTEVRTKLYNFIHGAVFVDAGNIWTLRESDYFPGGKFEWNDFLSEIAANTGVGLRLDFQILVLRLDFGFPIRKPWLPEGERWVFNDLRFGDPVWRKNNLIFNLAIGYPF